MHHGYDSYEVRCRWTVTVPPTEEPVSLEEAKAHARITDSNSDGVIDSFIVVAREACEGFTGRGLLTQTRQLVLDRFVDIIPLPYAAPLQSVSSITYYDTNGALQTLATSVYDVDTIVRPAEVVLKPNQTWPETQYERINGAVTIEYIVGWSTPGDVPERMKQGIRQFVAYLELDRDGMEPQALAAKAAAERHWTDRVEWTPPRWRYSHGLGWNGMGRW